MLSNHQLYRVHMRRKNKEKPGEFHTKDVLVQAPNTTAALQVSKEVERGYAVEHVTPSGIFFWRGP